MRQGAGGELSKSVGSVGSVGGVGRWRYKGELMIF